MRLILLPLLALLGAAAPLLAEEEPEAPKGIVWVDGWEAGRAAARERKQIILLYFGRKAPT